MLLVGSATLAQNNPTSPPATLYQLDKILNKSALSTVSCSADTIRYVRDGKATAYLGVTMNVPSEFSGYAQYYDCPQEITVSGMVFYAGVNAIGDSAIIECSIYTANPDSSMGTLVTIDTITVYDTYFPANIDVMRYEVNFLSPAVMNQPYFVRVKTHTTAPLGVMSDDYNANDGQGEAIGYWHWTGDSTWYPSGQFFAWDVDWLLEPIVTYDLSDSVVLSMDTACAGASICAARYASPVVYNRMYNTNAFAGNDSIPFVYDWNDGITTIENDSCHIYATSATYNMTLTTTNNGWTSSCSVQTGDSITITNAPIASFSSSGTNLSYNFLDLSSDAPDTYLWDFGDGNTSSLQNPAHTYLAYGTYTVCLTTTNTCGTDSTCSAIVICEMPAAAFSNTFNELSVSFSDSTSGPGISYFWDFGDGNTDTVNNPTHIYSVDGNYTVCLISSNSCGSDTICSLISVCALPEASFSSSSLNFTASFSDSSLGLGNSYFWDFGDGSSDTIQNPTNVYSSGGIYTVCLTVTNLCGTDSSCSAINVIPSSLIVNDDNLIQYYPNPTKDKILVNLGYFVNNALISVISADGKLVDSYKFIDAETFEISLTGDSGIYTIIVNTSTRVHSFQVIKRK